MPDDKPKQRFAKVDPAWLKLELGGRPLRVLIALSLHADWRLHGHGRCFPKRDTLALATGLQVSHVSEALKVLTRAGLITVVRLGRKNVYYVRDMGGLDRMPPSDPIPFFEHLGKLGLRFKSPTPGEIIYDQNSKAFDAFPPILLAIFSDYVRGLTSMRLEEAVRANQSIKASLA